MTKNEKFERDLRRFEAVQVALAKEDAKHMPTTPEIERDVEVLYAAGRSRLAEIRYAENARFRLKIVNNEIRPEVIAMSRVEADAQLAAIRARPEFQQAHREGESLSDRDVRAMLEDALRVLEKKDEP